MSRSTHTTHNSHPPIRRRIVATLLAAPALLACVVLPTSPSAAAAECTTTFLDTAGDQRWENPTNWTEQETPTHDDVVCVSGLSVVVSSSTAVGSLRGDGEVDVEAGADLRVLGEVDLGSFLVTDGRLEIAGGGTVDNFVQDGGTVTGTGVLSVLASFEMTGGQQTGSTGATAISPDAETSFTLHGALVWGDRPLVSDAGVTTITGAGQVDFGSTIVTIRNLSVPAEADVALAGTAIGIDRTGVVAGSLTMPRFATVAGAWTVVADGSMTLVESVVSGSIEVQSAGIVDVVAEESAGSDAAAQIAPNGNVHGEGDLVIHPGIEFFQYGLLDVGSLTVAGTVDAQAATTAGSLSIEGTLRIVPDVVVTANGTDVDGGTLAIESGATLRTTLLDTVLHDGVIELAGTIDGGLDQRGGRLATVGTPRIDGGDWVQAEDSILRVIVTDEQPAVLAVDGKATVAGNLQLVTEADDVVEGTLLAATGGVDGRFAVLWAEGGQCPELEYQPNDVVVRSVGCLGVDPVIVAEDAGLASVAVRLADTLPIDYPFTYAAAHHGTAIAGEDFEVTEGTATIPAGETTAVIEIAIIDDDKVEDDESFQVDIEGATASSSAFGTVTIVDDDENLGLGAAYHLDDIGSLPSMSIIASNANGVIGNWASDAETGGAWGYHFDEQRRFDLPQFVNSSVGDVNEVGQILGFRRVLDRNGEVTELQQPPGAFAYAAAIDDDGAIGGYAEFGTTDRLVHWSSPTAAPEVIDTPPFSTLGVDEMANGVIVGSVNDASLGWKAQGFRWTREEGFELLPRLAAGDSSLAISLNRHGTIVGFSGDNAVSWDADGNITDLGLGRAIDINDAGVIVGHAAAEPGSTLPHEAVVWFEGNRYDPTDLVPDLDGFYLAMIEEINDDGVMVGHGAWGGSRRSFVLRPYDCLVCVEARFEETLPGDSTPTTIDTATVEGNPVQLVATLDNSSNQDLEVHVDVVDGVTGEMVNDEPIEVTFAPNGRRTIEVDVDTDGMAWSNGQPADARPFDIVISDAESGRDLDTASTALLVDPRPVVLVHGLWSDASTWAAYENTFLAAHPRLVFEAIDTMDTSSSEPNTISQNAELLADFVDEVRLEQGAWSVDLVGHSMGGLISRKYIHADMPSYEYGDETRPVARRLVMLGTPNSGSPCAWLAPLRATAELRPDVVADFNETVTERRGVEFSVAHGLHVPFTCTALSPGDDVVPTYSAVRGMTDTMQFAPMAHTDMTGSAELFESFVLPRLNGTAIVAGDQSGLMADPAAAAGDDDDAGRSAQALYLDDVEVGAGVTTSVAVSVPSATTDVAVTITAPATTGAELVDPTGAVVASITPDPDAGPYPTFRTMWAPATAGRWILRLHNPTADTVAMGAGVAALGLPITLAASAEQVHWSGRVALAVDYSAPAGTAQPATIVGRIIHADGAKTIEVRDDGRSGDGAAGDNRYGVIVRDLAAGPATAVFSVITPGHTLATSAAVLVDTTPSSTNTAPVASDLAADIAAGDIVTVTLPAVDAEADDLDFTIIDQPEHGTIELVGDRLSYQSAADYRGVDRVTFTASDGRLDSAPATVTFTVGDPEADIRYVWPIPAEAAQGQRILLSATVLDRRGVSVVAMPVTFDLGGQRVVGTTGAGGVASVEFVVAAEPGTYDLVLTTPTAAGLSAGRQVARFTVLPNRAPAPSPATVYGDEAGYPVRFVVAMGDLDKDAVSAEWDLDGDGEVDLVGGTLDLGLDRVTLDHVYDDEYDGPVTVTIVDAVGNRGSATWQVDIGPNRPEGAMRRLAMPDGTPIEPLEWDRTGRYVLGLTPIPGSANPVRDQLVVLDRQTGDAEAASVDGTGSVVESTAGALSPDGRFVAFRSRVDGSSTAQVVLRDLDAGANTLVSATSSGMPAGGSSTPLAVADAGSAVLFGSDATDLGAACDGCSRLYRWSPTGPSGPSVDVVSIGLDGEPTSASPTAGSMSSDGRRVAFVTAVPGTDAQAILVDVASGETELISVDRDGGPGDHDSGDVHLDDDGDTVVFASSAGDLVTGDADGGRTDVFVRDVAAGTTRSITAVGGPAGSTGTAVAISGDGSRVAFSSSMSTLVDDDTNNESDVFVADVETGIIVRVSHDTRDGEQADGNSTLFFGGRKLTCDGASTLFRSGATNLVPGDVIHADDAFASGPTVDCDPDPADTPPLVDAGDDASSPEGIAVAVTGSVVDDGAVVTKWTATPGTDVDSGATCSFAEPSAPSTTVVCTDDGTWTLRLSADDGVNAPVSATVRLDVVGAAPTAIIVDPPNGVVVPVGIEIGVLVDIEDSGANDTTTCRIDFGDGRAVTVDVVDGSCSSTHVWNTAATRTIVVTATDDDSLATTTQRSVAVAAQSSAKVLAAGAVVSKQPAALVLYDPSTSGKTWMQLNAAGGRFRALSANDCSVAGRTATCTGMGMWNGKMGYRYEVVVTDGGDRWPNLLVNKVSIRIVNAAGKAVYTTNGSTLLVGVVVAR